MSSSIDLKGKVYGSLSVIKRDGEKNSHAVWSVRCKCGETFSTTAINLKSGNTTQCKKCYHVSRRLLSDKEVEEMVKLRVLGYSYQKIADMYSVGRTTAFANIKRHSKKKEK